MITLLGTAASRGSALGRAVVLVPRLNEVRRRTVVNPEAELTRLALARSEYAAELEALYDKTLSQFDRESANIFMMYSMILNDEEAIANIEKMVREQCVNADYAVYCEMKRVLRIFTKMQDEYMRERGTDVENICHELILRMAGIHSAIRTAKRVNGPQLILVAERFTPADIVGLDRSHVCGLIVLHGNVHSHAAILCRSMGLPAVVGVDAEQIFEGMHIALNGDTGTVLLEPDASAVLRFEAQISAREQERARYEKAARQNAVTMDGQAVQVLANIVGAEELDVETWDMLDGVGLLRTEYLYLAAKALPSEERQFEVYKKVAELAGSRDVVVSSFDIGGEKRVEYMHLPKEDNPFLGYRAIRICLDRRDLFATQLRAVLRASAFGRVKLMLPMITSVEELRETRKMLAEAMTELRGRGLAFDENLPLGAMIETPAAVAVSDRLAEEADFFVIGTNDITQFMLAVDATNPLVGGMFNCCHPAVLRCFAIAVKNAHKKRIPVIICGENARSETMLPFWLALGVEALSVAPSRVAEVKHNVRSFRCGAVREHLAELLQCGTAGEARAMLERLGQSLQ